MNKVLLALIAAGLWANAAMTFVRPAHADLNSGSEIYSKLSSVESDIASMASDVSTIKLHTVNIDRIESDVSSMASDVSTMRLRTSDIRSAISNIDCH